MKDGVSILMATYNTDLSYLRESIDSILNQTYKNFEFIIVCDGECKDYQYIIDNYKDDRIVLLKNKENKGLAYSLNKAIKLSKYKYLARIDSDDISIYDRIETQYNYMNNNKDVVICGMEAMTIGNEKYLAGNLYYSSKDEIYYQMLFMNCLIHSSVMIRKEYLIDNNINYNSNYKTTQDYELWSRISKKNICIIPKIGILYRIHSYQVSNTKKLMQINNRKKIICNNLKKKYGTNKYNNTFYKLALVDAISNRKDIICISNDIDDLLKIENNKMISKILYSKFLVIVFKNIKYIGIKEIVLKKEYRKKIFNINNIKYCIYVIFCKIYKLYPIKSRYYK